MKVSIISLLALLSASLVHAQTTLTINTRHSPPTSTIFQEVVQEVFKRNHLSPNFQTLPRGRALSNVNKGLDDGDGPRVAGLQKSNPNLLLVPEQISQIEVVAFTRGITFESNSWSSLAPYDIAYIRGTKILEKNVTQYNSLKKVKGIAPLFQLLQKDRVDVVIAGRLAGLKIAKQQKIQDIKAMEPPLAKIGLFLYLHKKHQKWVPLFSKTLQQMKQDGTHDKIITSIHEQ